MFNPNPLIPEKPLIKKELLERYIYYEITRNIFIPLIYQPSLVRINRMRFISRYYNYAKAFVEKSKIERQKDV